MAEASINDQQKEFSIRPPLRSHSKWSTQHFPRDTATPTPTKAALLHRLPNAKWLTITHTPRRTYQFDKLIWYHNATQKLWKLACRGELMESKRL